MIVVADLLTDAKQSRRKKLKKRRGFYSDVF